MKDKKTFKKYIPFIIAAVLVIALFAGAYANAAIKLKSEGIYQGVTFGGTELGGKSVEEAQLAVEEMAEQNSATFKINYLGHSFEVSPGGLGFVYDSAKIAQAAFNECREGNIFKRYSEFKKIKKGGKEIKPIYVIDREHFDETIETLLSEYNEVSRPFTVEINDNIATVTLNRNEKLPDYDALFETVSQMVESGELKDIEMPITTENEINANLIYHEIYAEPEDAYSEKDENGKTVIVAHKNGVEVSKAAIEKALSTMQPDENSFMVEVTGVEPKVKTEDVESGFFNDVLGTSISYYSSSTAARAHNVQLAAQKINGLILNCGDVFSYNGTVGSRTVAAGFKTATIYANGGITEEVGGGICQVSSTLYAATLYADLQIVERRNHTYTVAYSKPGLDATVYYGAIDFRFKNNTDYPVKIIAEGVKGVLTVKIMGTKVNNNKVEISTNIVETYGISEEVKYNGNLPAGTVNVLQKGQTGYKVTAVKTVKDESGKVIRTDKLPTSTYSAMKRIVEKGPDLPYEPTPEPVPEVNTPPEIEPVPEVTPAPEVIPEPVPTPDATLAPSPEPTPDLPVEPETSEAPSAEENETSVEE